MKNSRASLHNALFVIFVDFIGVGLIYPLFSAMLFDTSLSLLPHETSGETRGALFGILLALSPMTQFFSSPLWGALSDSRGRKNPLQLSLSVNVCGYIVAVVGVFFANITLLFISRILIGLASGNMSIVQATVADISTPNDKTKNFGLYSMALGAGFTLGPFFGGVLSKWGYTLPFIFALFITVLNLLFVHLFFRETHPHPTRSKLTWNGGLKQLKVAFETRSIRTIFLTYFLHCFAWSFFFEFIPVYLIGKFHFTSSMLGLFYGVAGAFYALSAGFFIRPFVRVFKPEILFFAGNFHTAIVIFLFLFLTSSFWIWPLVFLICYFVAFVSPTATTLVSNQATAKIQGETLGILSSANAAALILSPLFSGAFVGATPSLSIWISSTLLFACALAIFFFFRHEILKRR